jgi:hypothetical protein
MRLSGWLSKTIFSLQTICTMKRLFLLTTALFGMLASCKDPVLNEAEQTPTIASRPASANARCLPSSVGIRTPPGSQIAVDPATRDYYLVGTFMGTKTVYGLGTITAPGLNQALFIVKYKADVPVWVQVVSGTTATPYYVAGPSVEVDKQGGVWVTANFTGKLNFPNGTSKLATGSDGLVLKLNGQTGQYQLIHAFEGVGECSGLRMAYNNELDELYISSVVSKGQTMFSSTYMYTAPGTAQTDVVLMKLKTTGVFTAGQAYGDPITSEWINDLFYDVKLYVSGCFTGGSSSVWGLTAQGAYNVFAARIDPTQATWPPTAQARLVMISNTARGFSIAASGGVCYLGGSYYLFTSGGGPADQMVAAPAPSGSFAFPWVGIILALDLSSSTPGTYLMQHCNGPHNTAGDLDALNGILIAGGGSSYGTGRKYAFVRRFTLATGQQTGTTYDATNVGVSPYISSVRLIPNTGPDGPLEYVNGAVTTMLMPGTGIRLCTQVLPDGGYVTHE